VNGVSNSAGNGYYDGFLMSIDQTGGLNWAQAYGSIWQDAILSARTTDDGGYILAGESYAHNNVLDSVKAYIVKTDSLGNADCNSVSWTPVVNNQPMIVTVLDTTYFTSVFQKNSIPWVPVDRTFHKRDLCNGITGVDLALGDKITIYPNPFVDKIHLQMSGLGNHHVKTSIRNLFGQIIFSYEEICNSENYIRTIDLSHVSAGIYMVELNVEGSFSTFKLMKQ
jgi:hypothetical protein